MHIEDMQEFPLCSWVTDCNIYQGLNTSDVQMILTHKNKNLTEGEYFLIGNKCIPMAPFFSFTDVASATKTLDAVMMVVTPPAPNNYINNYGWQALYPTNKQKKKK